MRQILTFKGGLKKVVKRLVVGLFIMFALLTNIQSASAIAGDWRIEYRNPDNTAYIPVNVSTAATSSYRLFGGVLNGDNPAWYYFSPAFNVMISTTPWGGNHYTIGLNSVDVGNVAGIQDLLDAKADLVDLETLESEFYTEIADLDFWRDEVNNSIFVLQGQITEVPDWNQTNVNAYDYIKNKPTIPAAQVQSDWTQSSTTHPGFILNKPTKIYTNPTSRTLNTAFQLSTTTDKMFNYSVTIANTLTLSGGAAGLICPEYADNSGMSTNVVKLPCVGNGNTGTLVVGLTLNDSITVQVWGSVPPNKYLYLRTVNTLNTPTYTLSTTTQEVAY